MNNASDQPAVHVVDTRAPHATPGNPHRQRLLFVLFGVIAIAAVVLSRVPADPVEGPPNPIDAVARLEDAMNRAAATEVRALLAEDAVLTWPAGPPWGGPLSGSVELVTDPTSIQLLDHVATLEDYLAFSGAVGGETALRRCSVYSQNPELPIGFGDAWVICSFSIGSELLDLLSDDGARPFGQMRFWVSDSAVGAVLVETWEERFSPIDFLAWVRDERPGAFERIFGGRVTQPNYGDDAAAEILELARDYAAR